MTVSRRLLAKLAAARDALSHSHPGASEEEVLEIGLDLIIDRWRKRRGIGAKPRKATAESAPASPPATATPTSTAPASPTSTPTSTSPSRSNSTSTSTPTSTLSASPSSTSSPQPSENDRADATAPAAPPPTPSRSRYVPAAVWRAVWERDGGRCAYPLENGEVCGSTYQLELDHVRGWALGAATTAEECRVCCRPHQDVHARTLYGDDHMNAFTRPKGPPCSEPVAAYG